MENVIHSAATLRRAILRLIAGNDLFTAEEQLRANHNTHECDDAARLTRWLENTQRVAAERGALPATPAQCDKLHKLAQHPHISAYVKEKTLRLLPTYTQGEAKKALSRLQTTINQRTKWAEIEACNAEQARRKLLRSRLQVCKPTVQLLCPTYPLPAREQQRVTTWLATTPKGRELTAKAGSFWWREPLRVAYIGKN